MAHIEKAETKRTKDGKPQSSYRVRWTEKARDEVGRAIPFSPGRPDGRAKEINRQRTFRSKEAAQEYCDELNAQRHKVVAASPSELRKLGDRALGYFAQEYFEGLAGAVKPSYARETEAVYRQYIADAFATQAVASITAADIRRFRAELLSPRPKRSYRPDEPVEMATLARTTIKPAYDVLRRILDVAVVDGAILANPVHSVPLGRTTATVDADTPEIEARPLTAEQVGAVADQIARVQGYPIYALAVTTSAYSGLRAGELAGLNIGDVGLPEVEGRNGSLRVTRTRRAVCGGFETGTPKSKRSRTTVPVDVWLADDLRRYVCEVHPFGNPDRADYDPDAPLFPGRYATGETLPDGLTHAAIRPERATVVDPEVRRKNGTADRRNATYDPTATCIRPAPSKGYKWTVPINPGNIADHYFEPALRAVGLPHSR